ncbi:MAG: cytochrome c [Anaerolineae bacterium]|nr:cytochrome c [Anaerolineae bacterium]
MHHRLLSGLALLGVLLLGAACTPEPLPLSVGDLPASRNAARGAEVFARSVDGAPACGSCHHLDDTPGHGPGLAGYGSRAGVQEAGQSAEAYTFDSIVAPARHIVSGYSNIMYADYASHLNAQEIADLIAFLLGL